MIGYNQMIYSQEIRLLYNYLLGNIYIHKDLISIYEMSPDKLVYKQNIGYNMYIFLGGNSHIIRNNKIYKLRCGNACINSLLQRYKTIIKSDIFDVS